MSMPKGQKFNHGYSTVTGVGLGFREIAAKMTEDGDEMNHATARNILHRALHKISRPLVALHGKTGNELDEEAYRVAADPRFQEAMVEIITHQLRNKK
jgi:hypothetical protein